jgi:scyllo-inositol 2-dehydrogenase (NADP+)
MASDSGPALTSGVRTPRRVALVGYGLAGSVFHAPLIAATDGLTVAAIVTADPGRRARAASEHPNARLVGRFGDLWEAEDLNLDLVVVATPNRFHTEIAAAAITRGVAVVIDKPLALDAAQAQQIVDVAQQAGVMLTVFQNRRWDSDLLTLRRLLEEDRLGAILRFESRFERWRPQAKPDAWREREPPQGGGGLVLDLGSHLVDQALALFGPVTELYAEIASVRKLAGDDDVFLALRHAGGVVSHLRASAVTAAPGPRLRVLGERGALVVEGLDTQEDALRRGERPDTSADWGREPEVNGCELREGEQRTRIPRERGAWPTFYTQVADALRGDSAPPVDPRDAVEVLRVLDAARRSAADRTTVSL